MTKRCRERARERTREREREREMASLASTLTTPLSLRSCVAIAVVIIMSVTTALASSSYPSEKGAFVVGFSNDSGVCGPRMRVSSLTCHWRPLSLSLSLPPPPSSSLRIACTGGRRQQQRRMGVGFKALPKVAMAMASLPTPEESARALSEYMAKSHEEKLRAVKAAEEKAAAQVEALKKEIEQLKSESSSSSTSLVVAAAAPPLFPPPPEGSREELAAKLLAYQKFVAEYIVRAQQQKLLAIKAAEEVAERKFEQKMLLLLGSATPTDSALAFSSSTVGAVADNTVVGAQMNEKIGSFSNRNAKVSAAAAAGKSRWGDMETRRVSLVAGGADGSSLGAPPTSVVSPPTSPAAAVALVGGTLTGVVSTPPEVVSADHGLRADGGVGGPSLAERVALGSALDVNKQEAPTETATAAAAAAEVKPQMSLSTPPLPTPPMSLSSFPSSHALYRIRNAAVSAAGKAGKSRWGDMELRKAEEYAVAAAAASDVLVANAMDVPIPTEVEAADHGLRADGGVGGPTLAQRVALGTATMAGNYNHVGNGAIAPARDMGGTNMSADMKNVGIALSKNQAAYQKRSARIGAAAKAGVSRWGNMEIEKALATTMAAAATASASAAHDSSDAVMAHSTTVHASDNAPFVNLGMQLLRSA